MKVVIYSVEEKKNHEFEVNEKAFVAETNIVVKALGLKKFILVADGLTKEQFELASKGGLNPMHKNNMDKLMEGVTDAAEVEKKVIKQCEEVVELVTDAAEMGASTEGNLIDSIKERLSAGVEVAKRKADKFGGIWEKNYKKFQAKEARFDEIMNEWTAGGEDVMDKVKVVLGYIIKVVKAGVKFVADVVIGAIKYIAKAIIYVAKKTADIAVAAFDFVTGNEKLSEEETEKKDLEEKKAVIAKMDKDTEEMADEIVKIFNEIEVTEEIKAEYKPVTPESVKEYFSTVSKEVKPFIVKLKRELSDMIMAIDNCALSLIKTDSLTEKCVVDLKYSFCKFYDKAEAVKNSATEEEAEMLELAVISIFNQFMLASNSGDGIETTSTVIDNSVMEAALADAGIEEVARTAAKANAEQEKNIATAKESKANYEKAAEEAVEAGLITKKEDNKTTLLSDPKVEKAIKEQAVPEVVEVTPQTEPEVVEEVVTEEVMNVVEEVAEEKQSFIDKAIAKAKKTVNAAKQMFTVATDKVEVIEEVVIEEPVVVAPVEDEDIVLTPVEDEDVAEELQVVSVLNDDLRIGNRKSFFSTAYTVVDERIDMFVLEQESKLAVDPSTDVLKAIKLFVLDIACDTACYFTAKVSTTKEKKWVKEFRKSAINHAVGLAVKKSEKLAKATV